METNTLLLDANFDVQQRLGELQNNMKAYRRQDKGLQNRLMALNPNDPQDVNKGVEIATFRKRLIMQLIDPPIQPTGTADADVLRTQYAAFSNEDRLLWLTNLAFFITPAVRELNNKISAICNQQLVGQQHNFLLGGPSGMGKTSYLNWYYYTHQPVVQNKRNYVPVVMIDAPVNNKTPKPLLQRLIQQCGANYTAHHNEEFLLEKTVLLFQQCNVKLLIVDEIEHIRRYELKRRLLEISNYLPGIPIICASVSPQTFADGDAEIAGRWRDDFTLTRYKSGQLDALLEFTDLLLPFPITSRLSRRAPKHAKVNDPQSADFIEKVTDGVLRDIMLLINMASQLAIKGGFPNIELHLLKKAWQTIQKD